MQNLAIDILLEFAERQAYAPRHADFERGQRLASTGAAYRAAGLCPDCGKERDSERMRCAGCACKHALKCRLARQKAKVQ